MKIASWLVVSSFFIANTGSLYANEVNPEVKLQENIKKYHPKLPKNDEEQKVLDDACRRGLKEFYVAFYGPQIIADNPVEKTWEEIPDVSDVCLLDQKRVADVLAKTPGNEEIYAYTQLHLLKRIPGFGTPKRFHYPTTVKEQMELNVMAKKGVLSCLHGMGIYKLDGPESTKREYIQFLEASMPDHIRLCETLTQNLLKDNSAIENLGNFH